MSTVPSLMIFLSSSLSRKDRSLTPHPRYRFFVYAGYSPRTCTSPAEVVHDIFKLLALQHIFWLWCQRIKCHMSDHQANLEIRIDLMTCLDCQGRCNKLIMQCLQSLLRIIMELVNWTLALISQVFLETKPTPL